jgi:hypothetical protein
MDNKELNFDDFLFSSNPVEEITEDVKEEKTEEVKEETVEEETEETEEEETEEIVDETEEVEEEEEEEEEVVKEDTEEEEDLGNGFTSIIEMMHEHNGWEYNAEDFSDKDSIEGLNDFIKEVITNNSRPDYASEESQKFDEFIQKYGAEKAADYLKKNYGEVDYEILSSDNEEDAKRLMKDYLKKTTKFSDAKIEKQIKKAEDLGELDEDFEEMKEFMLESKKKEAEEFEKSQEQEKISRQKQYQDYLETQKKRITDSKEIAGFEMTDKLADELYKFGYVQGRDGKTGYERLREKDKDIDLKLLMLAHKGVDKAKIGKEAETKVAKKLKKELSRFKDKATGSSKGAKAPKKNNPKQDTDYGAFVL